MYPRYPPNLLRKSYGSRREVVQAVLNLMVEWSAEFQGSA